MPFVPPNQQCQSTEGKALKALKTVLNQRLTQHTRIHSHSAGVKETRNEMDKLFTFTRLRLLLKQVVNEF